MQRSNGNNNARQSSLGGGRRAYNRTNNNSFKFHNFVFNQDNQSFCLEEQHGNKKITVLHWKKSEGLPAKECNNSNKLVSIKSLSSLPSDDDITKDDHLIESAFQKTSSFSSSHVAKPVESASDYGSSQRTLEHASSSGVFLSPSDRSLESSVSVLSHPQSELDLLSKSNTTTSSSAYGTNLSSFASYYSNYSSNKSPELVGCSFQRARHSSLLQDKSSINANEDDEEDENVFEDDEMDSDTDDFRNYLGYRNQLELYTKLIEQQNQQSQPLDLSLKTRDINNNSNNIFTTTTTTKSCLVAQDSKEDDETLSEICESENSYSYKNDNTLLSSKCFRFAPNISISASELELHRRKPIVHATPAPERCDESISPSLLISSVKCCSPAPVDSSEHVPLLTVNPFMFPLTSSQLHSSLNTKPPASSSFIYQHHVSFPQNAPPASVPLQPTHVSHYQTTKPFTFDTFLEDEIYKILLQSSSSSSSSPPPPAPLPTTTTTKNSMSTTTTSSPPTVVTTLGAEATTTPATRLTSRQQLHECQGNGNRRCRGRVGTGREGAPEDETLDAKKVEESIEEKLRRLQHEIQQQQQQRSHFIDFSTNKLGGVQRAKMTTTSFSGKTSSGLEPCQDHLRLHFKFNANKNLELHRANEATSSRQQHLPSQSTRTSTPPSPPSTTSASSSTQHFRPSCSNQLTMNSNTLINQIPSSARSTRAASGGIGGGAAATNHRNQIKRQLEETFKQNGFLVKVGRT